MYEKHLKLNDIHVGDWVQEYSEITGQFSMPMFVSAILSDGTVYLDFNGNEGDIWETNILDIAPIKIDDEMLKGFGFEYDNDMCDFKLQIGDIEIYLHRFQYDISKWVIQFGNDVSYTPSCTNIHELQHLYYKNSHKPLVLNWKGI